MPRSNLNVVDVAVDAIVAGAGVLKISGFADDCTFADDTVPNGVAADEFFASEVVVIFVAVAAAGFSIGVLLLAVGVNSSGIFPGAAGASAAALSSTLCVDGGFDKFKVISDGLTPVNDENDGVFWTPPPPPNEYIGDAVTLVPNILLDVSVLIPNENGLGVAATVAAGGVSNEMAALLLTTLGTISLVDFSTVAAPNPPNDNCDFSALPKNDFDAMEFIGDGADDDDGGCGCCVAAALAVAIVACLLSVISFGLNDAADVVLATCGCGRIDNCGVGCTAIFDCVCCGCGYAGCS